MCWGIHLRRWVAFALALSLLLAPSSRLFGATVTGTIYAADGSLFTGTMLFRTLRTPLVSGSTLVTGGDYRVSVTNGAFSTTLLAGDYRGFVGADQKGFILAVPSGSGSYSLLSLITNALTYTDQTYPWENAALATATVSGVVKTDVTAGDPVVYLKTSVDALLATNSAANKLNITNGVAYGLSLFGDTIIDTGDELQDTVDYSLALTPNGNTPTENDASARPRSVATIASLVADVDPLLVPTYARVSVLGYHAAGDGGGGDFRRVLASSGTTNAGTFFASTANALYAWERVYDGSVTPEMFGAAPNDSASDQSALENALAYLDSIGGGVLQFREGEYHVAGLNLPRFVLLRGAAAQGQKSSTEGSTVLKLINGANNAHVITSTNECQIENLQIDGNKANVTGTSYGIYFNRPGVYIESAVAEVSVVNCRTAGIVINANEITVRNSSVIESDGYGIWVQGVAWDTTLQSVLVGWSGSDGVLFESGAAFTRVMNVDSYFSRGTGIKVVDPSYFTLYRPQIDYSFGHGLELVVNNSGANADIELPTIHDSNYLDDGRGRTNSAASGTFSEICISGTNYPSRIMVRDGRVAPLTTGTLKPLYNLCWSNTAPAVGYGLTLRGLNLETASGARTASGKSAADGWLTGYWNGLLQSYYDGTNATTFERSIAHSARWAGITPINAPTTMNGALTLGSTLSAAGSISAAGASATRDLNATKLGLKISSDTGGETFGISQVGNSLYIASDIDSTPSLRFNGPAGTFAFIGAASFNASVAASTFVSAGTQVSVGTTLELGHASDTTLGRQSAGVVSLESVPVIDAAVGTLAYSGTTVNITAGKGALQRDALTCTNNATLAWTGLAAKDGGTIYVTPAATNCTFTLPSYAFGPSGSTLTITGGTGNTNYTKIAWENDVIGGTNRVSVNALNYYR